jgi:hypothetical protein
LTLALVIQPHEAIRPEGPRDVPRKRRELPTKKLDPARVAKYAKRADAHVREGRDVRLVAAPDVDVRVEFQDEVPTAVGRSDVLPVACRVDGPSSETVRRVDGPSSETVRKVDGPSPEAVRKVDGPSLEAVPVLRVSRDDLDWFDFEAETITLLVRIDGRTTVGELLASVAVPPDRALTLLKDLELRRVIALD